MTLPELQEFLLGDLQLHSALNLGKWASPSHSFPFSWPIVSNFFLLPASLSLHFFFLDGGGSAEMVAWMPQCIYLSAREDQTQEMQEGKEELARCLKWIQRPQYALSSEHDPFLGPRKVASAIGIFRKKGTQTQR
jgi:hypothetical protein